MKPYSSKYIISEEQINMEYTEAGNPDSKVKTTNLVSIHLFKCVDIGLPMVFVLKAKQEP